jgi:S1-C subfamily serine protease
MVITLVVLITGLLLSGGVDVAYKTTAPTKVAAKHPSTVLVPPADALAPSITEPPETTEPGTTTTLPPTVAPVSPLTVPPVYTPPVTAQALRQPSNAIAAIVNPAIVDIDTRLTYQHAIAAGTGMVLTSSGIVLTNNHVIAGATSIGAVSVGNGRSYPVHVIGVNPSADVAIIQLEGASGLPTILSSPNRVAPGDPVVAIGNAGGVGGAPSVTTGVVQAVDQSIIASDPAAGISEQLDGLIETTAILQPGDSGGPLVNTYGQVIGMNTAASVASGRSSPASFAIPIGKALGIANQIEAGRPGGGVYLGLPPFLGVEVTNGTLAGRAGAAVTGVVAGGPADAVGVVPGSLIVGLGGQVVDSQPALTRALRQFRPGEAVTLGWLDPGGGSRSARLTLAAGPAD